MHVMVCAPTGAAAYNISGYTLLAAFTNVNLSCRWLIAVAFCSSESSVFVSIRWNGSHLWTFVATLQNHGTKGNWETKEWHHALLLNRVRYGSCTEEDMKILQGGVIHNSDIDYPNDATHIFAYNKDDFEHNLNRLQYLQSKKVLISCWRF